MEKVSCLYDNRGKIINYFIDRPQRNLVSETCLLRPFGIEHIKNSLCITVGRPKEKGDSDMPTNTNTSKKRDTFEREAFLELRERNQHLEAELLYVKKVDALHQEKRSPTKSKQKSYLS